MSKLHVLNGPQAGELFTLREGDNFVGRSTGNDIFIQDKSVSRRHLKIVKKGDKYFLSDLSSHNGTFLDGYYLPPGVELEVGEGVPIFIGLSVLCIGHGCLEERILFLDSVALTRENAEKGGIFEEQRDKTNRKKLELLHKVTGVLAQNLPVKETCEMILDHILTLLKRIDRGLFILIDPDSKEIYETISKPDNITGDMPISYLQNVVLSVLSNSQPLVLSNAHTEDSELADTLKLLKVESLLCVPMISKSDTIGCIYIDSVRRPYGFRLEDIYLFSNLAMRITPYIQYAQLVEALSTIAENLNRQLAPR